jgi:DNA-binding FadR family transcriptional regulator
MPLTRPCIVPAFAEVIEAIRTREPDRAEMAMKEHLAATKDFFSLLAQDKAVFGNRKLAGSPHAPNG